jgi:hypothetical protein
MFLRKADKNQITILSDYCALLGYDAASSGNFLLTFRDNPSGPILRVQESWNNPEERSSQLLRGGNLKSGTSLL